MLCVVCTPVIALRLLDCSRPEESHRATQADKNTREQQQERGEEKEGKEVENK